jgi:NAD(P)H dehydrogenase (quinone)
MNILSIYCHDNPKSLTASLKNIAVGELERQGHKVLETDLYASAFNPVASKLDFSYLSGGHFNYLLEQKNTSANGHLFSPDIMGEIEKVASSDIIIIHMPIWWFGPPAILKGWFDRIFAMGVTWDAGKIFSNGLLRGKSVLITAVSGFPEEFYKKDGPLKTTMNEVLYPIQNGIFSFCGFDVVEPFVAYNSLGISSADYERIIKDYHFKITHLIDSPSYWRKNS